MSKSVQLPFWPNSGDAGKSLKTDTMGPAGRLWLHIYSVLVHKRGWCRGKCQLPCALTFVIGEMKT